MRLMSKEAAADKQEKKRSEQQLRMEVAKLKAQHQRDQRLPQPAPPVRPDTGGGRVARRSNSVVPRRVLTSSGPDREAVPPRTPLVRAAPVQPDVVPPEPVVVPPVQPRLQPKTDRRPLILVIIAIVAILIGCFLAADTRVQCELLDKGHEDFVQVECAKQFPLWRSWRYAGKLPYPFMKKTSTIGALKQHVRNDFFEARPVHVQAGNQDLNDEDPVMILEKYARVEIQLRSSFLRRRGSSQSGSTERVQGRHSKSHDVHSESV